MRNVGKVEHNYEYMEDGVNINHFFVKPDHRQEGRGKSTLKGLIQKFEKEGYNYVVINMKGGDIAVEFLESCGFTIVEELGEHIKAEKEI
jgi:GNAT superfamily N-acetyltransferase